GTKVGGTKAPRREVILQLAPDLVICNEEENRREDFLWLADHNLPLYVTAPRTVADGIALLNKLGSLLGCQSQSAPLAQAQRGLDDRLGTETENDRPTSTTGILSHLAQTMDVV